MNTDNLLPPGISIITTGVVLITPVLIGMGVSLFISGLTVLHRYFSGYRNPRT